MQQARVSHLHPKPYLAALAPASGLHLAPVYPDLWKVYSGNGTPMNTRENYYMDAVAGRYERVFPVARIHTDVTIREGLVFGWRNATLLGPAFSAPP